MEFDTGAARTLMSKENFDEIFIKNKPKVIPSNTILMKYGETKMKLFGETKVKVVYKNMTIDI